MNIEDAIRELERECPGARRGRTAEDRPGSEYDQCKHFDFQRCQCSAIAHDNGEYDAIDYVAVNSGNPPFCLSINLGNKQAYEGLISCGKKGYHSTSFSGTASCEGRRN
jgi:hypothetical protein